MLAAPLPPNEAARLAALREYGVLDTPPEPEFDELAQLAADICGTPIASVTLIDGERQWFKARLGLQHSETSRDLSFCAHAILEPGREILEVRDAREDARFADNPLVLEGPQIRFYAGAPLVNASGFALGTLCVIDRQPRTLTDRQRRGLLALRRCAIASLELRKMVARQWGAIQELEQTRRALEQANDAKGRFLAVMSHEVRAPMSGVIGMASLLRATPLDEEQREYVDTILGSGALMLAVANDVLDYSKIEAGRIELEQTLFQPSACVAQAEEMVRPEARRKGLALRIEAAPGVPSAAVGDPVRLRQILVNLLSNAIKFTDRGEVAVRISARPSGPESLELHFTVADTGIGISPEQMARLFREYGQAEASTTRRYGGSGLGLVISKRLAELQGGRMWVESAPGRGSQFHFTVSAGLPANGAASPPAPAAPAPIDSDFAPRHPARILVADDDAVNRRVATRNLEKLGYRPAEVASGREAVDACLAGAYDLVLMDVEMPDLDGVAATGRLRRELPEGRQPAVIGLTAHGGADQRERFLAAGMDTVLTKPLRIGDLTEAIAGLGRRGR